jgi:nitrate/nitrite transporter NarK
VHGISGGKTTVDTASITAAQRNSALSPCTIVVPVCFAVCRILSIIEARIMRGFDLNDTRLRLLAATAIVAGSLLRIAFGAPVTAVFSQSPNSNRDARHAC